MALPLPATPLPRRFSARTPAGLEGLAPCRSRCYRRLLLCAADEQGVASNAFQAAQFVAEHYKSQLPAAPVEFRPSAAQPGGGRGGGDASGGGSQQQQGGAGGPVLLRVVLIERQGTGIRQVLNMEELAQRCTQWSYTHPGSGRAFAATCGTCTFDNLLTSIAGGRGGRMVGAGSRAVHGERRLLLWCVCSGRSLWPVGARENRGMHDAC